MDKQILNINKLNMILENSFANSQGKDKIKRLTSVMNFNIRGQTLLYILLQAHIMVFH